MSTIDFKYRRELFQPHIHQLVPQYQPNSLIYRTDISWPCKLCGALLDPNEYFIFDENPTLVTGLNCRVSGQS